MKQIFVPGLVETRARHIRSLRDYLLGEGVRTATPFLLFRLRGGDREIWGALGTGTPSQRSGHPSAGNQRSLANIFPDRYTGVWDSEPHSRRSFCCASPVKTGARVGPRSERSGQGYRFGACVIGLRMRLELTYAVTRLSEGERVDMTRSNRGFLPL